MNGLGRWGYLKLVLFSKPKCDRVVYRQIARTRPRTILELGLGNGLRTANLFAVAGRHCEANEISYTGIDLFDGRTKTMPQLKLKDTYCALRPTGVDVRLIPGEVATGLRILANGGRKYDLVVADASVAAKLDQVALEIIARLMGEKSVLIWQIEDGLSAEVLGQREMLQRSARSETSKAA